MRLIDADKLMLSLADWELQESPILTYPKPKEFTADDMQRMIWRTIRDCESAVEEQPIVPAIPIEWIEERLKFALSFTHSEAEGKIVYDGCVITMVSASFTAQVLSNLLEAWEEQNEKDI